MEAAAVDIDNGCDTDNAAGLELDASAEPVAPSVPSHGDVPNEGGSLPCPGPEQAFSCPMEEQKLKQ